MKFVIFLSVIFLAMTRPATAEEAKTPEYCEALVLQLEQAIAGVVRGDFSNRVHIALEAHKRLNCPPEQLLGVLRIKIDK